MRNYNSKNRKSHSNAGFLRRILSVSLITVLVCASSITALAYFTDSIESVKNVIATASYSIDAVETTSGTKSVEAAKYSRAKGEIAAERTFELTAKGTATTGYCEIVIGDDVFYTQQIEPGKTINLTVITNESAEVVFEAHWGFSKLLNDGETDKLIKDKDVIVSCVGPLILEGKKISVIGDSISSYLGWSDITAAGNMNSTMIGEPYYGPAGSDSICETLNLYDTWWMQFAKRTGAEILVNNSSNMSGVFSDRGNATLNRLLAYKERAVNLHDDTGENAGTDPDIIAVYIGSNEAAVTKTSLYGSVDAIDFDTLITENVDGTYTYAEPKTVAEAYSIMLHKMQTRYPDAEIYVFNILPNSGAGAGYAPNSTALLNAMKTRLGQAYKLNKMIEGVAEHFDVKVVKNFEGFNNDADGDTKVTAEEQEAFMNLFYEGPHPNEEGFDVITESFLEAILK